jgi:3'(2'), 5'-bisphosphate nucleotidase
MYENELLAAVAIARTASEAILKYYAGDVLAESKIGVDSFAEPVTVADRESSRIIVESLAKQFPDDGILSEEENDVIDLRLGRERVWIVDPIDGTSGFIKKDGDFAVQIGLADNGEPVVGVVLLPAHSILYSAAKSSGAFVNDKPLHVSTTTDTRRMNLAVSRNHRSPKMSRIVKDFGFNSEIQRGSVGLKVGLIAEQTCDAYIHLSPRTKMWDTCAPQIILEEAGGKLTDLWGEKYRYDIGDVQNWGGIVATNGAIHAQTIERLQPLLNEFGRMKVLGSVPPA